MVHPTVALTYNFGSYDIATPRTITSPSVNRFRLSNLFSTHRINQFQQGASNCVQRNFVSPISNHFNQFAAANRESTIGCPGLVNAVLTRFQSFEPELPVFIYIGFIQSPLCSRLKNHSVMVSVHGLVVAFIADHTMDITPVWCW